MSDRRPINGSGSCARCGASLDLASVKRNGVWFCDVACAEGSSPTPPAVPEPWLYNRPRRFFRKRRPRELRSARGDR